MGKSEPYIIERCLITERMTDEEIDSFNDSIECYMNNAVTDSDYINAMEINPALWKAIWRYRDLLYDYYGLEDEEDAE